MHFGMSIEQLASTRSSGSKPVLRKDFIIEEYPYIREARAFGADAVLLMANILDPARLSGFYDLARELDMEALFEVHSAEEISALPADVRVVGINSRKFKAESGFVGRQGASETDFSSDYSAFELVEKSFRRGGCVLPKAALLPSWRSRSVNASIPLWSGTSRWRRARDSRVSEEFEQVIAAS